ncbi:glycosyltransferase [Vibrio cholerae]|nr:MULTISPECIES: glycosyltransferase [Vibrio]MCG3722816.1 glycosyltransferase [Vibrio cincinnatiensis]EMP95073.1 glycosyl transferase, group 1 family protein [Vibrio paracholerae 87395]MBW5416938.1 glycosyltransferase [Vibrio cholerae]MEB5597695.1 glycosyltransferase [Vibrio cholerae]ORP25564.1 glycosyl transferase [Vibrio paracholerae]
MKIAFLMSGSYRTSLYAVTKEAIRYLREQGHWVDLFFLEKFEQPLIDNDQCIDVSSIHQSTLTRKIFRPVKKILGRHIYEFSISRLVTSKIENYLKDYDCIFIHGTACIALYKLKLPHYVVLHSCKYENFLGRRKGPMKILYQQVYKKIYSDQNLLTVSDSVRYDLINKMKAKPKSIETIYNGFNFQELIKEANQKATEHVPEHFIMAAGRPDRTKRFDILLKAYAKSRQILPLVIFGEGRKLNELKKLAVKLGIENKVIFWGFCNDLLPYFKQASAYILSSDVEGLPTVVIESLAVGTPVVATDVGGVSELLGERLKEWIVPRRDVDALAKKIDQVLEYPPSVGPEDLAFLDYRVVGKKYEKLSEKMKNGLL